MKWRWSANLLLLKTLTLLTEASRRLRHLPSARDMLSFPTRPTISVYTHTHTRNNETAVHIVKKRP